MWFLSDRWFLSNRYKSRWSFIAFVIVEFAFTIPTLALFGIASPDLYRTKLWADGSDNGFNSSPTEVLYDYANYRPVHIPAVWSQFITDYNVAISVLSMFIMLVKVVMFILHVFPPWLSALVHGVLCALYAVSIRYQAGSDMSDPQHPQPGPPWYITKSCSVAAHPSNVHYCTQAKAAFACTCIMLGLFFFHLCLAIWSAIPTKAQKQARRGERKEDPESPLDETDLKSFRLPPTPGTTGGMKSPMTPRTLAFNRLGGTKDLPLRNHFSTPNAPTSPTSAKNSAAFLNPASAQEPQMFFPPPPRMASK